MFPALVQIIKHYRDVLAVNEQPMVLLQSVLSTEEMPVESECRSLSTPEPLLHYLFQPGDRIPDIGFVAGKTAFWLPFGVGLTYEHLAWVPLSQGS